MTDPKPADPTSTADKMEEMHATMERSRSFVAGQMDSLDRKYEQDDAYRYEFKVAHPTQSAQNFKFDNDQFARSKGELGTRRWYPRVGQYVPQWVQFYTQPPIPKDFIQYPINDSRRYYPYEITQAREDLANGRGTPQMMRNMNEDDLNAIITLPHALAQHIKILGEVATWCQDGLAGTADFDADTTNHWKSEGAATAYKSSLAQQQNAMRDLRLAAQALRDADVELSKQSTDLMNAFVQVFVTRMETAKEAGSTLLDAASWTDIMYWSKKLFNGLADAVIKDAKDRQKKFDDLSKGTAAAAVYEKAKEDVVKKWPAAVSTSLGPISPK